MISFDEACLRLADLAEPLDPETVGLEDADGRVLAQDILAACDSPAHAVSAMDGYAIRDSDLKAGRTVWPICGEIYAGDAPPGELPAAVCARIFTGAPLPAGFDRVVPQELVRTTVEGVTLDPDQLSSSHIRQAGSDFRAHQVLLRRGRVMDPGALLLAAAADRPQVSVSRRPRVAIISSGDELVAPGTALDRPGRVPDSVSYGVASLARRWGAGVVRRRRAPDDLAILRRTVSEEQASADLIVMTGGASVGERDFARAAFEQLELIVDKVAMKPGKPVWIGRSRGRLVVGLPGNPTAAMVTARLFLAPLLAALAGRSPSEAWAWRDVPAGGPFAPTGEREVFVRASMDVAGAHPCDNQDSSAQAVMGEWTLLARRDPASPGLPTGAPVRILAL
ncbi:molybdopterin molybdotransferase MoeA [Phenylobacterium sp.]|uniref:molybdopterin molybdotransferase MoeA n=1 Tax=Phenylobacterium sp. TaxID=1871053 RepID=UPI002731E180|nr:molybdopterin molybdotransferase MoeA [Phenylobacterium sp.]MDP1873136.1 molybdopterin molybdotransferase MoeA [Phenylobacterium sp.]